VSAAILSGFLAVSFGLSLVWRMRDTRRSDALRELLGDGIEPQAVPDTLIPKINKELCIGSGTCVAACPEHNVIGIVDGVAKLITPSACVGHGECAAACPVGAIKLVFGTREQPVQLPAFDRDLQTNLPGVYIAGEVSGISLIRNAIKLGRRAADAIAANGRRGSGQMKDALVIGAGPAGVSAALALRKHGLSVEVLERSTAPLATLRAYPAQKRVQLGKVELAGGPRIRAAALDKEELLDKLIAVTEQSGLAIHANEAALAIEPRAGGWSVKTARGQRSAANVVVALGRRGAARRLDVPGDDLPKVHYELVDPSIARGLDVLVVGGGNSAIESLFALLDQGQAASVTLSYRRARLTRLRADNSARFDRELARGRMRVLLSSQVVRVAGDSVLLRLESGSDMRLPNQLVVAQLGALSPVEELRRFGIAVVEKRGER
jgi:thioredoxin reductase (NADPH)